MLTKWGRISSQFVVSPTGYPIPTFTSNPAPSKAIIPVKDIVDKEDCYARVVPNNVSFDPIVTSSLLASAKGVIFGSGTTPATENDYDMPNRITSGISVVKSDGSVYSEENDTVTYYLQYTITNTSQSEKTISEMGIIQSVYTDTTSGGTSSSRTRPILADHTVLAEPLVIPAGESGILRWSVVCDVS